MIVVNSRRLKWLLTAVVFALCVGPTFISYQPYLFAWDDSEYLLRSIAVSRAFWSRSVHGLGAAMVGIHPPAMTLMGIPWGPIQSWAAAGKCFITLAAVISLLAALCLYLVLRIGVKPVFLLAASACVFASLGPFQRGGNSHDISAGFMADSLLAWTCLAAVLLVPYEGSTPSPSISGSIRRGILWGAILSLGAMTKLSFVFFILSVLPLVFVIRIRRAGLQQALAALLAFMCCLAPSAFFFARWGKQAFEQAHSASNGQWANLYYLPLLQFFGSVIRNSPGLILSIAFLAFALMLHLNSGQTIVVRPRLLALLIMIAFGIVVLASPSRLIRYSFPAIIAVPFLSALLISDKEQSLPRRSAGLTAGLVFFCLLIAGVPTGSRSDRRSISRCDAVLAQAAGSNAKRILLATDSPTLNKNLMDLAIQVSPSERSLVADTLAYRAMSGVPIEEDFHDISLCDEVVFQDRGNLGREFTNQRVPEYERYAQKGGRLPARIGQDISVYMMQGGK